MWEDKILIAEINSDRCKLVAGSRAVDIAAEIVRRSFCNGRPLKLKKLYRVVIQVNRKSKSKVSNH